jgi:type II secretory pathway component GspD/PulD (secretin)
MPFVKSNYKTGTGGNVLGSDEESNNIDGTIELKSSDNEFDVWKSIEANLNSILDVWTTATITETAEKESTNAEVQSGTAEAENKEKVVSEATRLRSSNKNVFIIDKPVGMVTVTAPRPLLDRVDTYFKNLKRELYKQISIEAKIIEVKLTQNSSIGINWNEVLRNFSVDGVVEFGSKLRGGQVYPFIFADEEGTNGVQSLDMDGDGISRISHEDSGSDQGLSQKLPLTSSEFHRAFFNALKEQGDTKVLSNPKISLMNGQPGSYHCRP